ncbi:MAG: CTB family bacteriocin (plasmid) [Leptolyngbya sp. BL-A-14]
MTTEITTETTAVSTSVVALAETDLQSVAGGAHQASGSTFDRHRGIMGGETFSGPGGAGSVFSLQEEDIHSSAFEAQDDN